MPTPQQDVTKTKTKSLPDYSLLRPLSRNQTTPLTSSRSHFSMRSAMSVLKFRSLLSRARVYFFILYLNW